jgi:hypothetical protein
MTANTARRTPFAIRSREQLRHQARDAIHRGQDPLHLLSGEHERHPGRALRADKTIDPRGFHDENAAIQENDRGERLDVCGRTDVATAG